MDDLRFFQKIDVPTALGAMDQDPDLGFWHGIHGLTIIGTQMNADKCR